MSNRTILSSAFSMVSGTFVSRILGFIKLFLLTSAIGSTTDIVNSFELANTLPNVIFIIISGGLFNTILLPQIIKASKNSDGGNLYINKILSLSAVGLFFITVIAMFSAKPLTQIFTSNWSDAKIDLTVSFALWCLPQIFFYGVYTLLGQILNAKGSYISYMWAPVVNNIIAILGLIFFVISFGNINSFDHNLDNWTQQKTFILAGTATLGVIVQAIILFFPLILSGFKFKIVLSWNGIGLRNTSKIAFWAFLSILLSQITYLITTKIITIPAGFTDQIQEVAENTIAIPGNAAYNTAFLIFMLPHSVITVSMATILFTKMSHSVKVSDYQKIQNDLSKSVRYIGVFVVFASACLIVLSGMIGKIFSGSSISAGAAIGQIIIVMAISVPFYSVNFLFQRVFYAFEDSKTPFLIQIPVSIFVVIGNICAAFLPAQWIVFGVGVVLSLGNILSLIITKVKLQNILRETNFSNMFNVYVRLGYSALFSALFGVLVLFLFGGYSYVGFAWASTFNSFITIIPVVLVMGLSYLFFLKIFRINELKDMLSPLISRLFKSKPIVSKNFVSTVQGGQKSSLQDEIFGMESEDDTYYVQADVISDPNFTETLTIIHHVKPDKDS